MTRQLAAIVLAASAWILPSAGWSQTISYGPIIGRGITPDKMIVKWGTGAAADPGTIGYRLKGSAVAFTTVSASTAKDHEAVLSGLAMDSQYEYYVQSGSAQSATYSFGTCPAPGSPMDVVFYGDSRSVPSEHQKRRVDAQLWKAPLVGRRVELVATVGDQQKRRLTERQDLAQGRLIDRDRAVQHQLAVAAAGDGHRPLEQPSRQRAFDTPEIFGEGLEATMWQHVPRIRWSGWHAGEDRPSRP